MCIYPFFDELIETANDNLFDFFFFCNFIYDFQQNIDISSAFLTKVV